MCRWLTEMQLLATFFTLDGNRTFNHINHLMTQDKMEGLGGI
jgi:hypothetical protein